MACPMVCPKFKAFRKPRSNGSISTTYCLIFKEGVMISVQSTVVKSVILLNVFHCSASAIKACLMISPKPLRTSRGDNVSKKSGEINTALGFAKTPIEFLTSWKSMPNLPPMLESTWLKSVVGIWIKSIPRLKVDAAKPPISPITPPPTHNKTELRSAWAAKSSRQICWHVSMFLFNSPEGIRITASIVVGKCERKRSKQDPSVFSSTRTVILEYFLVAKKLAISDQKLPITIW